MFFNRIFWACIWALNTFRLSLGLLGLPVTVHLFESRSRCATMRIFMVCGFVVECLLNLHDDRWIIGIGCDIPCVYGFLNMALEAIFYNYHKSGSRKMMKRWWSVCSWSLINFATSLG